MKHFVICRLNEDHKLVASMASKLEVCKRIERDENMSESNDKWGLFEIDDCCSLKTFVIFANINSVTLEIRRNKYKAFVPD